MTERLTFDLTENMMLLKTVDTVGFKTLMHILDRQCDLPVY